MVGYYVDFVVFDLVCVIDCVMFVSLMLCFEGIEYVFVNGWVVFEYGCYIGVCFGWVLCCDV